MQALRLKMGATMCVAVLALSQPTPQPCIGPPLTCYTCAVLCAVPYPPL